MKGFRLISRGVAAVFIFLVRVYQWTLSPVKNAFFGAAGSCRFRPTCSQYAIECFRTLPLHRALWLAGWRILRCNPWGGSGWDPVPRNAAYRKAGEPPDREEMRDLSDLLNERK